VDPGSQTAPAQENVTLDLPQQNQQAHEVELRHEPDIEEDFHPAEEFRTLRM